MIELNELQIMLGIGPVECVPPVPAAPALPPPLPNMGRVADAIPDLAEILTSAAPSSSDVVDLAAYRDGGE